MNDLERLKQAEPMAVISFPMPGTCEQCPLLLVGIDGDEYLCGKTGAVLHLDERTWGELPDFCEIKAAIGIIEPNGHVVYLREEKK